MLKINGLTKIYGRSDVKAVDDLSLEVESGEIFGFIGPNGAGKSTLMKILSGVYTRDSGSVEIFGKEYGDLTPKQAQCIAAASENYQKLAQMQLPQPLKP